ncbi:hypothetical protein B0T10DRAFT_553527 [Thelonectria olida]|uniref:CFEM domain-containing protein n=1 Tax=Thelonectria olida TaxID=1576542 RepID=A0A9P9AK39_9HYPO|nr:hypothetical protein B0T10DRAFT_553527 [Thelonectria olida]
MNAFVLIALISASTLAQDLSGLPACAQTCALDAIGASGCAVTDVVCICLSDIFISAYSSCVATSCNATDAAAATSFGVQYCASGGVTIGTAAAASSTQASTTMDSALQTTQPATTLITTTDSAGNVFTVTGEILVSGTSSTTVPCRTIITTNAAGVLVTSTETGLSVLTRVRVVTDRAARTKLNLTGLTRIRDAIVKFHGISPCDWRRGNVQSVKYGSCLSRTIWYMDAVGSI